MSASRRVLIYKRTHIDDPNSRGEFGCADCMGRVRGYEFDAVIGIGGHGWEPRSHGIDGKITWVGVGPHKEPFMRIARRGPVVTFDRFALFNSKGPKLRDFAPALADYFFGVHRRYFFSQGLTQEIQRDIARILELAPQSSSTAYLTSRRRGVCKTSYVGALNRTCARRCS